MDNKQDAVKIVAMTDIHGEYPVACGVIDIEKPDILILGGDIFPNAGRRAPDEVIEQFKRMAAILFAVAGNMDDASDEARLLEAGISLNARGAVKGGIGFFGVSASPLSRLKTNYEISEDEIYSRLAKGYGEISVSPRKILVSHAPPHGTKVDLISSGVHVGSHSVRKFIMEKQPDLVICGHIHEARGTDRLGSTPVVNCGSAAEGHYARIVLRGGKFWVTNESLSGKAGPAEEI